MPDKSKPEPLKPQQANLAGKSPSNVAPPAQPGSVSESFGRHLGAAKVIRFQDLACCEQEVWIELEGQFYRLRKTRHNKLLLSK
jgi:hemin uptake protein HemP